MAPAAPDPPFDAVIKRTRVDSSKSLYLNKRCDLMNGLTVAASLGKAYLNAKGESVKYKMTDLKYDLKGFRLELVGGSAVQLGDAQSGPSAKRTKNPRSQEEMMKNSKVRRTVIDEDAAVQVKSTARPRLKAQPPPARAAESHEQESSSESSSDSSKSTSSSDDGDSAPLIRGSRGTPGAVVKAPVLAAAVLPIALPAPPMAAVPPIALPAPPVAAVHRPRGYPCAKMLVRCGLRCACHYVYRWECPTSAVPT